MDALKLGPLVFSPTLVALVAAVIVALFVARKLAQKTGAEVEKPLWLILLGGLVAGRAGFVIAYSEQYFAKPWTILDVRDGGVSTIAALAAIVAITCALALYRRDWRKPLLASMAAGVALWGGLTGLLIGAHDDGQRLPRLALPTLDGKPVQIDRLGGKPMVINIWASWCPPCRREMPVMQDAQRANQDIVFVFVNQGEDAATVQRYLDAENLRLDNVLLDGQARLPKEVGSVGMPTTLFFDRHGKLVDKRVGEFSAATLAHRMEALRSR